MRRAVPLLLALTVAAAATVAPSVPASAEGATLDRPRHGREAVEALSDRLPAVAAAHGTTAELLRQRLLTDRSLWVDREERLFYVDEAPAQTDTAVPSSGGSALSQEQVMALHSRPGAQRTIHLDVDGIGGSYGGSIGSSWSRGYTGGDGVAEPYSLDADLARSFSRDELADIYSIWQRVAEDFAPFEVDVTTQDPGFEAIDRGGASDEVYGTRVALTSTATHCRCGGAAYVGVFDATPGHASTQPAFVYNEGAKYAGEAASHEAGHSLGLNHDGRKKANGTIDATYAGHDDWAPIMGLGYYRPISQWDNGSYPGATNGEDDLAVAGANGAPLQTHVEQRRPLALDAPLAGRVEHGQGVDEFALEVPGEAGTRVPLTVAARTAFVSANTDLEVTLLTADGAVVGGAAPANPPSDAVTTDAATGLSAVLRARVPPGSYVVQVRGVGTADYTTYGSVGTYALTATTGTLREPGAPAAPTGLRADLADDRTFVTLTWTHRGDDETGFELAVYDQEGKGSAHALAANRASYVHRTAGTWTYAIRAVSSGGASAATKQTAPVTVVAPASQPRGSGGSAHDRAA